MNLKESWFLCPFPALSILFVVIILSSGGLMLLFPALAASGLPVLGAIVATCAVGLVIEMLRRKATRCPWLELGGARRVVLYFTLFVVGLLVVFPGVWPTLDVMWPLRVPFVVFAIAIVALLRIHKTVDHGDLEEAGVGRGIYFASRLPLFLVVAIAAFLVLVAGFELTGVGR